MTFENARNETPMNNEPAANVPLPAAVEFDLEALSRVLNMPRSETAEQAAGFDGQGRVRLVTGRNDGAEERGVSLRKRRSWF